MIAKELASRLLTSIRQRPAAAYTKSIVWSTQKRLASTTNVFSHQQQQQRRIMMTHGTIARLRVIYPVLVLKNDTDASAVHVSEYVSRLRPFNPPAPPQPVTITPLSIPSATKPTEEMHLISTLRRRRLKMNKHKYKKLRKRTRALRRKLGK
ncbi:hypothetical protein BDF20DRAFT_837466 [Mycotypha africana]|uniref:uncharacterized protein n=1 Tax=Mycotypha africana TaxID=64632 RepID=UPI0023019C82|nr:uncharacterized protein BDF20DRAFT_837466 [Mycotypha africana]KAI8973529.1 hypothetical protein BDF20DRAFT_837466 [Mycotypha africana]